MSRTLREVFALVLAGAALAGSLVMLERTHRKAEPRRELAQAIRREASDRDIAIVVDESPELVDVLKPIPAVWGIPPITDLTGVRRIYGMATSAAALTPFFMRLGPAAPFHGDARVRRWEVASGHLNRAIFQAADAIGSHLQARREGGAPDGPCPLEGDHLACHGEAYLHVAAVPLHFDGVDMRCIFAHPHDGGRLVLELSDLPPAHAILGVVGIDDGGVFPQGVPVTMRVEYRAAGAPVVAGDVVAPNRRGVTPWRFDVAHQPASATLTVMAPNTGARQFCFTLTSVE